jgi:hypothetical protein
LEDDGSRRVEGQACAVGHDVGRKYCGAAQKAKKETPAVADRGFCRKMPPSRAGKYDEGDAICNNLMLHCEDQRIGSVIFSDGCCGLAAQKRAIDAREAHHLTIRH